MCGHLGANVAMGTGGFCDVNKLPCSPGARATAANAGSSLGSRRLGSFPVGALTRLARNVIPSHVGQAQCLGVAVGGFGHRELERIARFLKRLGVGASGSPPSDGDTETLSAGVLTSSNSPGRA